MGYWILFSLNIILQLLPSVFHDEDHHLLFFYRAFLALFSLKSDKYDLWFRFRILLEPRLYDDRTMDHVGWKNPSGFLLASSSTHLALLDGEMDLSGIAPETPPCKGGILLLDYRPSGLLNSSPLFYNPKDHWDCKARILTCVKLFPLAQDICSYRQYFFVCNCKFFELGTANSMNYNINFLYLEKIIQK